MHFGLDTILLTTFLDSKWDIIPPSSLAISPCYDNLPLTPSALGAAPIHGHHWPGAPAVPTLCTGPQSTRTRRG